MNILGQVKKVKIWLKQFCERRWTKWQKTV